MSKSAVLAALAGFSMIASGVGTRSDWWRFQVGLALFALAGVLAACALVTGLIESRRGSRMGTVAALVGLAVLAPPALAIAGGIGKPRINDVSTDLDDPPRFETLTVPPYDLKNAPQQRAGYPDVQPRTLTDSPSEAFARARAAVEAQGWRIAAADSARGTIEAVDTTGFFGFQDDVIVRVRPNAKGSRIDVRSKSRVGQGDLGKNAKRIREFLQL